VFEKSCRLLLHKLRDHIAEHRTNGVKSLICRTNVIQAMVIKKDFLDNEDGNGLAELRARLHDSKAQRDDFGR